MTVRAGKQARAPRGARGVKAAADPFENVVRFEPITGPVLGWRLAGRRLSDVTDVSMRSASAGFSPTPEAEVWHERQRRHMYNNEGRPLGIEKRYVCRRGHVLLWLVRSPWGVTPIARIGTRLRSRGRTREDGAPMSLAEWPAGEHLPIASCPCHPEVETSLHQARGWLESRQDKFVHQP